MPARRHFGLRERVKDAGGLEAQRRLDDQLRSVLVEIRERREARERERADKREAGRR